MMVEKNNSRYVPPQASMALEDELGLVLFEVRIRPTLRGSTMRKSFGSYKTTLTISKLPMKNEEALVGIKFPNDVLQKPPDRLVEQFTRVHSIHCSNPQI